MPMSFYDDTWEHSFLNYNKVPSTVLLSAVLLCIFTHADGFPRATEQTNSEL